MWVASLSIAVSYLSIEEATCSHNFAEHVGCLLEHITVSYLNIEEATCSNIAEYVVAPVDSWSPQMLVLTPR